MVRRVSIFAPMLAAIIASPPAFAEDDALGAWERADVRQAPPARFQACLVAHPERTEVYLLGGSLLGEWSEDFWIWDGRTWSELPGPPYASSRLEFTCHCDQAAYDPVREELVYVRFSEDNESLTHRMEELVWDGDRWSMTPIPAMGARTRHALTFDPAREELVLHGGADIRWAESECSTETESRQGCYRETWRRDRVDGWVLDEPTCADDTPDCVDHAYFDTTAGLLRTINYAEGTVVTTRDGEWEQTAAMPSLASIPFADGRGRPGRCPMTPAGAYNSTDGYWFSYGPLVDLDADPAGDVIVESAWTFGATNAWDFFPRWRTVSTSGPAPEGRRGAAMVYVPSERHFMLFGGSDGWSEYFDDTWRFVPSEPASGTDEGCCRHAGGSPRGAPVVLAVLLCVGGVARRLQSFD